MHLLTLLENITLFTRSIILSIFFDLAYRYKLHLIHIEIIKLNNFNGKL